MRFHLTTLLLCIIAATTGNASAARRPNIVVILSDDFGYGSAGCYGADPALVRTPNLDRLAKEGRRFTDANTTSSVCSPTRYSLLTGRYCWRTSLKYEVLNTFAPLHIEPTRLNMASLLKAHGYSTAAVGKWHLGYGTADDSQKSRTDYTAELSPGPLDIGFDYHFAVPSNHGDLTGVFVENRSVFGLRNNHLPDSLPSNAPVADSDDFQPTYGPEDTENAKGTGRILDLNAPRRKNERVMKVLTDKATAWLQRQPKNKPFFLYFTPVAVHNPVTPDKDLAGSSAAGLFGDWIHELDRSVGRILQTLDHMNAAKDTLVVFSSDNGGVFKPDNERLLQTAAFKAGLRPNGGLRGGKHDVWEGGFKVPFLVRWPGMAAPDSVSHQMISLADLLATTAAILDSTLPPHSTAAEDSRNILPAILGDPTTPVREDLIVHSADGVFAIRKGPWKWIEGEPVDDIKPGARKANAAQYHSQLYNTQEDPAEAKDVSAQHPEVIAELKDLLRRYRHGGYSRQLPPADVQPPRNLPLPLPPLTGSILLNEPLSDLPPKPWTASAAEWTPRDSGLWGAQKAKEEQPAALRTPLAITDGTIDFEVNLIGANRTSLRIECSERKASFRVELSRTAIGLTKNPSQGEDKSAVEPLARKPLELESGQWYPVRITFHGRQATAQIQNVVIKGTHPVFEEPKTAANFLVFGSSAGFRNVRIAH